MPCVIGTLYKWKSKIKQENCVLFSEFLEAGQGKKIDCQEIKADAPAIIAYTGGTTGKAKGVLLSNRAANTIAFQYKYADKVMDFQNGERFLDIIPPFLVYGLMKGYGMTEMAGPVCISNHKFLVMLPLFYDNIKILDIDTGAKKYNCLIKDIKLGIVSRVNHKMLAAILERDTGASAIKR